MSTMWTSVNPKNGSVIRTFPRATREQAVARLSDAVGARFQWRESTPVSRARLLRRCARQLDAIKHPLARMITDEMGKPILQSLAEIDKSVLCFETYAQMAAKALRPQRVKVGKGTAILQYEPLGLVLGIMPWNFPVWQTARALAPALAAGNLFLVKPAPNVLGTAELFQKAMLEAGVPRGVFQAIAVEIEHVAELIADSRVAAVTLTGSERAGREVAKVAGSALKKIVLELGGSDAYVVLKDAPLEKTLAALVESRLINSGQSCVAVKRVVVERGIAKKLLKGLVGRFSELRVGDPMDPKVQVGPLARRDLVENLERQVQGSVASGAELLVGGRRIDGPGWFYAPTVLGKVRPGMPAFDEEVFGPVLSVIEADDVEHAVDLANRSRYGLGGAVFSASKAKRDFVIRELEAGIVGSNTAVRSDPRVPFGGVKASGYGRELGLAGMYEFCNLKTVLSG